MGIRRFLGRFLSALLCAALLCGMIPGAALGEEEEISADTITNDTIANDTETEETGDPSEETTPEEEDTPAEEEGGGAAEEEGTANQEETEPQEPEKEGAEETDTPEDLPAAVDLEGEDETESESDIETQTLSFLPTTTATLTTVSGSTKKITLESYLTNTGSSTENVKPCDIIFLMDQSKWMNTEADKGAQREAILSELRDLVSSLAEPSTGEHRVAIAGYGRVNMNANTDPYEAATYPGTKATGGGISLNTGYYTASGFVSMNGWSDLAASQMSGTGLPQMSASFRNSMTYDNAFLSLDEAEEVLASDNMMAWYAGASRMDAGLTITEQLASIAKENDTSGERSLLVCILTSSLPIQNTAAYNTNTIRTAAVLAASEVLKSQGATIFAFGSYHNSGKTISGTVQDTEETFTATMEQVCSKPEYFYSFSSFSNVTEALNQMITQIAVTAAGYTEETYTVEASEFTVLDGEEGQTLTWQDILSYYGDNAEKVIDQTMTKVSYYSFLGYDSDGTPLFASEPYKSFEVPLRQLVQDGELRYETLLLPLPATSQASLQSDESSEWGNKISITISSPLMVTYQWASGAADYAPENAGLPEDEIAVLGTTHPAAAVRSLDESYDSHYTFGGWYLDPDCTTAYTGTEVLEGDLTLYGKWEHHLVAEYYWNQWESDYTTPDEQAAFDPGEIPSLFTPEGREGYQFEGWYLDKDLTQAYEPAPATEDIQLYAKWSEVPGTWALTLIKESDTGDRLSGAVFALYTGDPQLSQDEDTTLSERVQQQLTAEGSDWYLLDVQTTDDQGEIRWQDLAEGTYYLLEVEAPQGYTIGDQPGQTLSSEDGESQIVTVVNHALVIPVNTGVSDSDYGLFGRVTLAAAGGMVLLSAGAAQGKKKKDDRT